MLIMTGCAYTRYGLRHIARRLAAYSNTYGGNIILFDACTASLSEYLKIKHPTDWVLIFEKRENKTVDRYVPEINAHKIKTDTDIETIVNRCATALGEYTRTENKKWSIGNTKRTQLRRKKQRMLQLFSHGYTMRMTSQIMNVNDKTLYGWAREHVIANGLKNLTQLRYLAVSIGADKLSKPAFK